MFYDLLEFSKGLARTVLWWLSQMGGEIVFALSHWNIFVGAAFVLVCTALASRFMRG